MIQDQPIDVARFSYDPIGFDTMDIPADDDQEEVCLLAKSMLHIC